MPLIADSLRNLSAALVTAALVIAGIVIGRDILVPLTLAGISCFVLIPIVIWAKKQCVPDGWAEGIVLFLVLGFLSAASFGLSSQLLSLAAELPKYRTNVLDKVRSISGPSVPTGLVGRAIDAVEGYQKMINSELQLGPDAAPQPPSLDQQNKDQQNKDQQNKEKIQVIKVGDESTALYGLRILAEPLTQLALTFLFTLFLLMQYRDLRDRIVRIFGVDHMTDTTAAMSDAGDRLIALFTGQVILNAGFGIFVGIALLIIGVPNAPLWGVVAFVMRFVPFVGSYIAAVPPILLAAAVDPGWTKAICTLAVFAVGEPIMGQVLEPLVLGRRAGLSPFAMVLATSFWTLAWGPIGLILAAPITLIVVVLGKYVPDLEFITVLLGDEPPLSECQSLYHRFLAGDAFASAEQIEDAQEESSPEKVLDLLIFPAVALSARDRRRGRLDKEAFEELTATIEDVANRSSEAEAPQDAEIVFVPMRGVFDELAARFAVDAVNRAKLGSARGITQASGLAALSFLAEAKPKRLQKIILLTAAGLGDGMARIMFERARGLFPSAEVIILDMSSQHRLLPNSWASSGPETKIFTSFEQFSEILRSSRGAAEEPVEPVLVAG